MLGTKTAGEGALAGRPLTLHLRSTAFLTPLALLELHHIQHNICFAVICMSAAPAVEKGHELVYRILDVDHTGAGDGVQNDRLAFDGDALQVVCRQLAAELTYRPHVHSWQTDLLEMLPHRRDSVEEHAQSVGRVELEGVTFIGHGHGFGGNVLVGVRRRARYLGDVFLSQFFQDFSLDSEIARFFDSARIARPLKVLTRNGADFSNRCS